ncbi:XRE family transcriptional regulator [Amycolatopsis sp. NPDC102389]|uniref:XRE family transcriptional regulator n=1 Tax=Amycolatopsis sp. NPDC102389 TaxID=3363941 RepID=UPI0038030BDF
MTPPFPGPFAITLDAAIDESGLSLERLQHHLATRGVRLSRSALSYWRRGRSQPERETSLHAVTQLELVLGLPSGALISQLGPRAPRGRWLGPPANRIERRRLWPDLRTLPEDLRPPPDGQLSFWSVHDRMVLDEFGREHILHVRLVAEAKTDGVDRLMTYYQADNPLDEEPVYRDVRCARLGRVHVDTGSGMVAGEMLLDRTLGVGEVTALDYEIRFPPGARLDHYHRRFTRPAAEYLCQVQFGLRVPKRVRAYEQRALSGPQRKGTPLSIGTTRMLTLAMRDLGPGIQGACWDW